MNNLNKKKLKKAGKFILELLCCGTGAYAGVFLMMKAEKTGLLSVLLSPFFFPVTLLLLGAVFGIDMKFREKERYDEMKEENETDCFADKGEQGIK